MLFTGRTVLERSVLEHVRSRRADTLRLATDLIAAASPNPPGDERAAAATAIAALRDAGISATTSGPRPERANVVARVPPRAPGTRRLLLAGHLDTKPPGDLAAWHGDPYAAHVDGGDLVGLGATDMKAAVAAMITAAGAIRAAGGADGELVLVLSADEEMGGDDGAEWLARTGALQGDAAVIGEPCGVDEDWEAIHVAGRGASCFRVIVHGTQTHSSLSDRGPAVNAGTRMARLMARLETGLAAGFDVPALPLDGARVTVNVGVRVGGGIGYGVLPGAAWFESEVRTVPGMERAAVEQAIEATVAAAARAEGTRADVEFDLWLPATLVASDDPVVLAARSAAGDVLGRVPPLAVFPGGTDAPSFQLRAGIPTIPSLGPGLLRRAHAPDERVSIAAVHQAAELYAVLACRYLSSTATGERSSSGG
jgi:acetylornithine deacetylase/succinyl-diaminopimelate desuccinylase-like protein